MSNITLQPCPHEDCTVIGHHWHEADGSIRSHSGSTCTDPWSPTNWSGCVDTHKPAAPPGPESSALPDASPQDPWVAVPQRSVIPAGVRHRLMHEYAEPDDWDTGDSQATVFVRRSDLPKVIPSKSRRERIIDEVMKASVWPQSALTNKRSRETVGEWLDAIETAVKVVDGDE